MYLNYFFIFLKCIYLFQIIHTQNTIIKHGLKKIFPEYGFQ